MFICDKCHTNKSHLHFFTSNGKCEICGNVSDCYACYCNRPFDKKIDDILGKKPFYKKPDPNLLQSVHVQNPNGKIPVNIDGIPMKLTTMTENHIFPNWSVANIALNDIIEKYFKLYVEFKNDELHVGFLPDKVLYIIPTEDREKFKELYNGFMKRIDDILNLEKILYDEFTYKSTTTDLYYEVFNRITTLFEEHNIHVSEIKNCFKGVVGIPGYSAGFLTPNKAISDIKIQLRW